MCACVYIFIFHSNIIIFISGTLQPLEKKIVIRKKPESKLSQQTEIKVPNKVVPNSNTKDEDSVERIVRKIRKLIATYCKENHKPLDFFQLVLHPHDFGRVVRNILYVSFLVKDGVVKLKKGIFLLYKFKNYFCVFYSKSFGSSTHTHTTI